MNKEKAELIDTPIGKREMPSWIAKENEKLSDIELLEKYISEEKKTKFVDPFLLYELQKRELIKSGEKINDLIEKLNQMTSNYLKILKGKGRYILLEDNESRYFLIGDSDFESFNNKKIPYPDFDKEWIEKHKQDLKLFAQYTEFKIAEEEFEKYSNNDLIISYKNNKESEEDKQIIEAKSLPKGWKWIEYNDGSGHLNSPDDENYFFYDLQTKEYKIKKDEHYDLYTGTFFDFKKYAEKYIIENIMIKVGEKYTIQNGIDSIAIVIDYKNQQALLKNLSKDNSEYIVANGIKINDNNKLEWLQGFYCQDLSVAARRFESRTNGRLEDMNTLKKLLNEEAHEKYVECVISNELRNGFTIEKEELNKLDKMYNQYIDEDDIQLISEDFYEMSYMANLNKNSSIVEDIEAQKFKDKLEESEEDEI